MSLNDGNFPIRDKVRRIAGAVGIEYGLTVDQVLSENRVQPMALARQLAMYLCREDIRGADGKRLSYPVLARAFGMDHTTVLYAVRCIEDRIMRPEWRELVARIRARLSGAELPLKEAPAPLSLTPIEQVRRDLAEAVKRIEALEAQR